MDTYEIYWHFTPRALQAVPSNTVVLGMPPMPIGCLPMVGDCVTLGSAVDLALRVIDRLFALPPPGVHQWSVHLTLDLVQNESAD